MISRSPLPLAAAFWALWSLGGIALLIDYSLQGWLVWFMALLGGEVLGSAFDTGMRDTLSGIMTWVQRRVSKHRRFARGWNAVILAYILIVATVGVAPLRQDWPYLSIALLALVTIWLWDHWINPDLHG